MIVTQNTKLNVVPGGIIPVVHVSQYDVDRAISFTLYDGNGAAVLDSGTTASIEGTKPDGHGFSYEGTLTDNVASFNTTQQMTVLVGAIECKLKLVKDTQIIGTAMFILDVEKAGLNESTVISDTDIPMIISLATEQMERAEAAAASANTSMIASGSSALIAGNAAAVCASILPVVESSAAICASILPVVQSDAESAEENALKAEGHAIGKQNGQDVGSESPYYHDNAKYWAEQSQQAAQGNVTGVKGNAESTYRDGNVNLTPATIGYFNGSIAPMGGCIPASDGSADKFLCADGSWKQDGGANDVSWAEQNELGAKNLIPYPYYSTTTTNNGITFTDNGDGTITANGTATANANFTCIKRDTDAGIKLKVGETYTLSGCPSGGGENRYILLIDETLNGSVHNLGYEYGDGVTFTLATASENYYNIIIRIFSGVTVNNLVFKPMLRLSSIADDTYVPYAKTNRELTEDVNNTYQAVKLGESITVTADGVKTLGTLMNEMNAAFASYANQNLASNKSCRIMNLNIPNFSNSLTCREMSTLYTSSNGLNSKTFYSVAHASNTIKSFFVLMKNSGSLIKEGDIKESGSSYITQTDYVLSNNTVITLLFDVYKKI